MRLQSLAPVVIAAGLVLAARNLGAEAREQRATWPAIADEPYAPSPEAAPFVTLGYREVAADLLWIRALGYFGGDGATSPGVRNLVAAIVALDPRFEEAYVWSSLAMQSITMQLTNDDLFAVIAILEGGMRQFPDNYRLPMRVGEIYARGLKTDDPEQQKRWKAEGARYLSRAVRLPDAPKGLGTYVAHLQTEVGQREQAIRDLRELITYTTNTNHRDRLVKKLAALTNQPSEGIAYELDVERTRFQDAWRRDRPELPATMFVVLGPPLPAAFDLRDLAADPSERVEPIEPLPPLSDDVGELTPPRR